MLTNSCWQSILRFMVCLVAELPNVSVKGKLTRSFYISGGGWREETKMGSPIKFFPDVGRYENSQGLGSVRILQIQFGIRERGQAE